LAYAKTAEQYLDGALGSFFVPVFHFYAALSRLAVYEQSSDKEQQSLLEKIGDHQSRLRFWSDHAPMNFEHKWALIEAERCRVLGDSGQAMIFYEQSIKWALENSFQQEAALACERAACFYLQQGNTRVASLYMSEAYYGYSRWGAKAKVDDLVLQYPTLLQKLTSSKATEAQEYSKSSMSSSGTHSETLDVDVIIKSTRTLSGELSSRRLNENLLELLNENAGARRCVLLQNLDDKWIIVGERDVCKDNHTKLLHQSLAAYHQLPQSLIQQVITTQNEIVLDDAQEGHQRFIEDEWFQKNPQIKSVLCQPIVSQQRLLGLIYMENELASHVFHQERLQLTQMLAAQAAISIDNAQLYENLEQKVKERTEELKKAQARLLQHARESGQAEIAIEVMHNIGNALTPLKTNTELTYSALHNSNLVKQAPLLMQRLGDAIASHETLEAMEQKKLNQITQVLPGIISDEFKTHADNLEQACDTIRRIEEFIHLQSKYTTVKPMNQLLNVNDLLNDALTMLDNLLQSEHIKLTLNLAELPLIDAEEHQLIQIFLSVIKNACEAMILTAIELRELVISTIFESTEVSDNIVIKVKDSGIGFVSDMKSRIFAGDYSSPKKQVPLSGHSNRSGFKLHACANYLIANGGTISAQSEGEGKGAVFTIELPVKSA